MVYGADSGCDSGRSLRGVEERAVVTGETRMEGLECGKSNVAEQVGRREWNARRWNSVAVRDADRQTDFCRESRERKRAGIERIYANYTVVKNDLFAPGMRDCADVQLIAERSDDSCSFERSILI